MIFFLQYADQAAFDYLPVAAPAVTSSIPAIIGAIGGIVSVLGTIIASWFAYNQYSKNKLMDLKIERLKAEEVEKSERHSGHVAIIYGILWGLLTATRACRVYILQPHPLVNNQYVSIALEVTRNGVSKMRDAVKSLPMSEMAHFVQQLATEDFMFFRASDEVVGDKKARALMANHGTQTAAIRRLVNAENGWIGSLFIESVGKKSVSTVKIAERMADAANSIQDILPEYKPLKS